MLICKSQLQPVMANTQSDSIASHPCSLELNCLDFRHGLMPSFIHDDDDDLFLFSSQNHYV